MEQGLKFTAEQWEIMVNHLQECLPEEGCGMVGGKFGLAKMVFPVTNDLHSTIQFRMNPIEQLEKMQWIEDHQMNMIGVFHSHPEGPPYPSITDIEEFAYPGVVSIIFFLIENKWNAKGFRIQETDIREVPLTIVYSS